MTSELILILFLVVAEGFGYKNWSLMEPTLSTLKSDSPESHPLNFFVITCIVFGIGAIQYALTMLVALKYPPAYVEFVDLCAVANISVIMFNEDLNGWYIHGKSPSGAADVSSERLRLNLEAESQGNATIRGITASHPEAQTFEIFLPNKMIDDYRKNFLAPVMTAIETQNQAARVNYGELQRAMSSGPALPNGLAMSDLDQTKELMNKIMKKYIE
jgi:meckelin|tara:strand:- start:13 stop:660 length:648 start_codon:yes stop_codon:yes gene_type:complete